jgi:hypothetical protein
MAKETQREWRRPGRATGRLRCKLNLPSIDLVIDRRSGGKHALGELSRFLRSIMPTAESALEGGSFVVSAEIRSSGLGVRWRPICRWKAGESVSASLSRAATVAATLTKEDWDEKFRRRMARKLS